MNLSRFFTLLFSTLIVSLGVSCGGKYSPDEDTDERPRQTVETLSTQLGSVSAWLETTGVVESEAEANIIPEAAGVVLSIEAEEGDSVRRGEVLATIANANLDAGLSRAASEVARAGAPTSLNHSGLSSSARPGTLSQKMAERVELAHNFWPCALLPSLRHKRP